MPEHMEKTVGYFYWLTENESPPKPSLGTGSGVDKVKVAWVGPGWYGPGEITSLDGYSETLWYTRADHLEVDIREKVLQLAADLKLARRIARTMKPDVVAAVAAATRNAR